MTKQNPRVVSAELGKARYIGRPCKKCGGVERHTANANCVACQHDYNLMYQKTQRAKLQHYMELAKAHGRLDYIVVGDRK